MDEERRIACLSLDAGRRQQSMRCECPQGALAWDVLPVEPDLQKIRDLIPGLLERYAAVALDGLTSTFRIGRKLYRHEYIWSTLELAALGERLADGSALLATLERWLVSQAAEKLRPYIEDKNILLFSGLNRYGSAEVLSGYSRHLLFGDMLYGFRLGIPITSFKRFVSAAPGLIRMASMTPASWYWPQVRRSPRLMPRFSNYFRWADVIVGGFSYFERYMPDSLAGKVIFTNLHGAEDVEPLAKRGARFVVSLTPVVGGTYVPLPVLEAALRLARGTKPAGLEDELLNQLSALKLEPKIFDLAPEEENKLTLVELPVKSAEVTWVEPQAAPRLSSDTGIGKFCFVIHPLSFKYIQRLAAVRAISGFVPHRLIEDAVAQMHPFIVGALRNVSGLGGARAEGLLYAVPMTSHVIMRYPPEHLYRKLLWVAEDAKRRGCKIMGLGAYTSVAGDAGLTVSKQSPIGVTSGNSYTVAMTMRALKQSAARCGIPLKHACGLVIGATGSIGSICARLLAADVAQLCLVGPRPEKLLTLASLIERETPRLAGRVRVSRQAADFLALADLIITTTSAIEPVVDVAALKPGCVVCDVARPPDIKPEEAAKREDILVIESGEIKLPQGAELTYDIGLPPGMIYGCLAETVLLALEQSFGHFTLGREIDPARVRLIEAMGDKHGFELSPVRSFGAVVPDALFDRLARINNKRFNTAMARKS